MSDILIYCCENKISNKKYIGYTTKGLEWRIDAHYRKAKSRNKRYMSQYFTRALAVYPESSFEWSVLRYCKTREEACDIEMKLIKEMNTLIPYGYNMSIGGLGGAHHQSVNKKISNSLKKFYSENPEKKNKINLDLRNKLTQGIRKRNENDKKNNIPHYLTGSKRSDESKDKMKFVARSKNRFWWYNLFTKEFIYASQAQMKDMNGDGSYYHLKNKRMGMNKKGWIFVGDCVNLNLEELFNTFNTQRKSWS